MNTNILRYVVAVAKEKSFTAAAKKLSVAQPSLSQSIRSLEKQLGAQLFDRSANPLTLTRAGEIYIKWAEQTLRTQLQIERQITDTVEGTDTILRIGASAERTRFLLSPIMKRFYELRPRCIVQIHDVTTSQLVRLLESEEIDLMIGTFEVDQMRYASTPICDEQILLAVPASFDMDLPMPTLNNRYPEVDLTLFKDAPFLSLHSEQTLGTTLRQFCAASGFVPNIRLECHLLSNLHNMIADGIGVGLVGEPYVRYLQNDDNRVRYYSLKGMQATRHISAIYRSDHYLSLDALSLINLLQRQALPL
ncbi:MAG: LysR family transcriptional regulator [Oscillospiraceae bacterium]|nr:LysR family transcriptional regulator [Oscillospiraceae bacterium]